MGREIIAPSGFAHPGVAVKMSSVLNKVIKTAALSAVFMLGLALTPAGAVFAAERESNGWIYSDMEDVGLRIAYPAAWKKTLIGSQKSEPDNILKVSGAVGSSDASWGELALSNANKDISASLLLKMMEEGFWSKLPDYKGAPEKKVSIHGDTGAMQKELTFRQNGVMFSQRCLLFKLGAKSFCLTLTCPLNDYQNTGSLWNSVLNSLGVTSAAPSGRSSSAGLGSSSASAGSATTSGVHSWRSKDGLIAFSYPAALKENVVDGDGHLLNATSLQNGKSIGLDVYRGDAAPNLTLSEHSAMLEDKYFSTQKGYQKVAEEPREMGFGGGVPGVVREATFENNGVKVHQLSGFMVVDKYLYAISFSTAGYNSNEAHQMWTRLVSSFSAKH